MSRVAFQVVFPKIVLHNYPHCLSELFASYLSDLNQFCWGQIILRLTPLFQMMWTWWWLAQGPGAMWQPLKLLSWGLRYFYALLWSTYIPYPNPYLLLYRDGHYGLSDCPGQLKVTVGQLNFPLHLSDRTSKIWTLFMLKAVVGTENPANENQTKNVGKWISFRTSENYPHLSDWTSLKISSCPTLL